MSIKNNKMQVRLSGLLIMFMLVTILLGFSGPAPAAAGTAVPHPNLQALQAKAAAQGQVRVIIGLNIPFTPEGDLAKSAGPQAVQSQQQSIKAAQTRVWQQIAGSNSQLIANFKYIPAMAAVVNTATLDKLASLSDVAYIQEDRLSAPTLASSIPVIGADNAWTAGYTGAGQAIAILDTGVDTAHSFFQGGKVISEACYSTTYATFNSVTICPDGNDPTFQDWQIGTGSGIDCTDQVTGSTAEYGCTHGTHVAGIAAGNDGVGPDFGVAKDANIISIQVYSYFSGGTICDNCVQSYSTDQIRGMERVLELSADFDIAAINMSLGGDRYYSQSTCDADDPSRKAAIDNLRAVGIATVISSGNDGYVDSMSLPACISSAISVGATDDADTVASFSNVVSFLDLYAPGVAIDSSVPGGVIGTKNGTSMAAPHVAGAWAVLRSYAGDVSVANVSAALKATGTPVDDNRTGGTVTGIPRINVDLAMANLTAAAKGSIIVEKQTVPDGAADTFSFTGTAAGTISDNGQIVVADLPAGTYFSTETVPAGWDLTDITCDDANSSGDTATGKATFHLEAGETVTCTFTNTKVHTLTVNTSGNGGVTAVPDQTTFFDGETVELTAAADPGWTFAGWSDDASGSENPLTVTMDDDKTITATFTQDEYTLTVDVIGGGSVTPVPDQAVYYYGDVVELTATANTDWTLSEWSGDLISTTNPISLTMDSSKTVTATFIKGDYALDITVSGSGTVTADPDRTSYGDGEVIELTAVADPGWSFSDWSGDLISTTNPISHTMTSSQAITATFTQDAYTLTLDVVGDGSVTAVPDQTTYHYGDVVELTATANTDWSFFGWSGAVISTSNPISVTLYSSETITATFIEGDYALDLTVVGSGSAAVNPDKPSYGNGEVVELTATADPGWSFSDWSGDLISTTNPISHTMTGSQAITATFTQDEYTLTIDVVGDGSVTAVPAQATYHYGDVVELTAAADLGWTFSDWSGDITGTDNPDSITITGNHTVTATFTQDEYSLTVDMVGDGAVTAVPDQAAYHYGDVVELTAAADPGWTFSDWSGDVISSSSPVTFTVTSHHAITATFTQNEYTLTVDIVGDGSVTAVPDQASYHYGDVVTLTAVPDTNRAFNGWGGATTSTDNPLSFTVTGSYVFSATFIPEYKVFLPTVTKE